MAAMFLRFPASANAPDQASRIAAYTSDMARFPLWAIKDALASVSGTFAPSSAELVNAARKAVEPVNIEIADISKILRAETYRAPDASERARIEEGFRDTIEWLNRSGREEKRGELTGEDCKRITEGYQSDPVVLPPMSEELRALCKAQRP
jgi:hypothetical protein